MDSMLWKIPNRILDTIKLGIEEEPKLILSAKAAFGPHSDLAGRVSFPQHLTLQSIQILTGCNNSIRSTIPQNVSRWSLYQESCSLGKLQGRGTRRSGNGSRSVYRGLPDASHRLQLRRYSCSRTGAAAYHCLRWPQANLKLT